VHLGAREKRKRKKENHPPSPGMCAHSGKTDVILSFEKCRHAKYFC